MNERCLHPVGRWGEDVRCGLPESHPVHDPLGDRMFPDQVTWPMKVHVFDVLPLCPEDEPPVFADDRKDNHV